MPASRPPFPDHVPSPLELTARTCTSYWVPLVSMVVVYSSAPEAHALSTTVHLGVVRLVLAGLNVADVVGSDARFAGRGRPGNGKCGIAGSNGVNGRRRRNIGLCHGVAQGQHETEQGGDDNRRQSGQAKAS